MFVTRDQRKWRGEIILFIWDLGKQRGSINEVMSYWRYACKNEYH
jgi:hypothetical protein